MPTPLTSLAGKSGRAVRARRLRFRQCARRWSPAAPTSRAGTTTKPRARRPCRVCRPADRRPADGGLVAFFDSFVLAPGVPLTHPQPHWTVDLAREGRASRSSATSNCSAGSGARLRPGSPFRRDHRHQREVDHDGLDRASLRMFRLRRLRRRQYRDADPRAGAAGTRPRPRRRMLVVPDRSRAVARSVRRRAAQRDARSPRSSRHDGALRRHQGTADRRRRSRRRLHRRSDHGGRLRSRRASTKTAADRKSSTLADGHGLWHSLCRRYSCFVAPAGGVSALLADLSGIGSLRGAHNGQNAAAAVAALGPHGYETDRRRRRRSRSFPGLKHRLEEIGRRGKCAVRQRFQGDERRCRRKGAAVVRQGALDSRRQGEKRAASIPLRPLFSRVDGGLSRRRSVRCVRRRTRKRKRCAVRRNVRTLPAAVARAADCRGGERGSQPPSSCCRPRARRSINIPISKSAVTISAALVTELIADGAQRR